MESIVYSKIIDFIRPKLSPTQFGFLSKRCSVSQLLSCYSEVMKGFDSGHDSDMIYLDFRKAFDSVAHKELLFKLWRIGITGPLWSWFDNYLLDRHHYVSFEGAISTEMHVRSGVPQGSILGPLLFLIYINDIHEVVRTSSEFIFADDTKILQKAVPNAEHDLLQEEIYRVCLWCTDWKLKMNTSKCSHIHFSLRTPTAAKSYVIEDTVIRSSDSYKDLGITVTSTLSWSKHLNRICGRAYAALATIRRTLPPSASPRLKRHLYVATVRSLLVYGSQVWRPRLIKDIKKIESVQRRATKYILMDFSLSYRDSWSCYLFPCGWRYTISCSSKKYQGPSGQF